MLEVTLLAIMVAGIFGFFRARHQVAGLIPTGQARNQQTRLHSRPLYHGIYVALWVTLPPLLLLLVWVALDSTLAKALLQSRLATLNPAIDPGLADQIIDSALEKQASADSRLLGFSERYSFYSRIGLALGVIGLSAFGFYRAFSQIGVEFRARNAVERVTRWFLSACAAVALLATLGIVLSLIFESLRFFSLVSPFEFLFGLQWSPQMAIRADQAGASGAFGAIPLFAGTLLITAIALFIAVPLGLLSAIYLAEYARPKARQALKPTLEILAGIPTVVYGFFAALTVAPFFRQLGESFGFDVSSESAIAAGSVMGVMIIPFVSSLSDDIITAVPRSLREASLGLGATQSETICKVVLPAALPGIVSAFLLAMSRAIGETMIVAMAAGLAANLTANPFESVTTVTVQIVTLLVGDQEFDSPKTLAAFALGFVLFLITLLLNLIALLVVRRFQEKYE